MIRASARSRLDSVYGREVKLVVTEYQGWRPGQSIPAGAMGAAFDRLIRILPPRDEAFEV